MLGALAAGATLASAAAWGWPVGRRLVGDTPAGAAFGLLVGMGALARTGLVLGEVGHLSRPALAVVVAAPLVLGGRALPRVGAQLAAAAPRGAAAFAVLFAVLLLYPAVVSPIWFWDTRVYHLGLPEMWLAWGRIARDPAFVFSHYPNLGEGLLLYAFLAPSADPGAVLLATAPIVPAAVLLGGGAAWVVLLATPAFVILGLFAKNTLLLGLASLGAVVPLLVDRGPGRDRTAGACGIGLGLAAATHYAGLFILPLCLYAWRGLGLSRAAVAVVVAALVAAPPYLANLVETGNPVHPFFTGQPAGHSFDLLGSCLQRAVRGSWEPFGLGSTFGPLLLIGAIGALLDRQGRVAHLLALGVLTVVGAWMVRPRYAIGATLYLAGGAARFWESSRLRRIWAVPLALVGLLEGVYLFALYPPWSPYAVAAGHIRPEAYLERYVPEVPLAAWARANLPPRPVVATLGVHRTYGWAGRLEAVSEAAQPCIVDAIRNAAHGIDAAARLRAAGFTHIAVHPAERRRLARQYGQARFDDREEARLAALLRTCEVVAATPAATLYALPSSLDLAPARR